MGIVVPYTCSVTHQGRPTQRGALSIYKHIIPSP